MCICYGKIGKQSPFQRQCAGLTYSVFEIHTSWAGHVRPARFLTHKTRKMILLKKHILEAIQSGDIVIDGMKPDAVKSNSVDLRLSPFIVTLGELDETLDVRFPPDLTYKEIGAEGMVLYPQRVYLGSTVERTFTPKHVPIMHGKSSIARLGISVHDAGFGDIGFAGHWTLELTVAQPVRVYAGMPICQLEFQEPKSLPSELYADIEGSSYTDAWDDPKPQPSRLWQKLRGENPQP